MIHTSNILNDNRREVMMIERVLLCFIKFLTFFVMMGFPIIILSVLGIAIISILKGENDEKD